MDKDGARLSHSSGFQMTQKVNWSSKVADNIWEPVRLRSIKTLKKGRTSLTWVSERNHLRHHPWMISTSEPLMKIEFVEVQKPICRSYGLFTEINPAKIIEDGKVRVIPEFVTKTRIHTSLNHGQAMKGINMEVDGIKTYRDVTWNKASSSQTKEKSIITLSNPKSKTMKSTRGMSKKSSLKQCRYLALK